MHGFNYKEMSEHDKELAKKLFEEGMKCFEKIRKCSEKKRVIPEHHKERLVECWTKSAEMGFPPSIHNLGCLYQTGVVVEQDKNYAQVLMTNANIQEFVGASPDQEETEEEDLITVGHYGLDKMKDFYPEVTYWDNEEDEVKIPVYGTLDTWTPDDLTNAKITPTQEVIEYWSDKLERELREVILS